MKLIIWTNSGMLLIGTMGTNFSEILIESMHFLSFKEMHMKMSSGKWRTSCLGLNVLEEAPVLWWEGLLRSKALKRAFYLIPVYQTKFCVNFQSEHQQFNHKCLRNISRAYIAFAVKNTRTYTQHTCIFASLKMIMFIQYLAEYCFRVCVCIHFL